MRITFLGGTGTVTGSKYLLEADGRRVLVDCGLFQGYKQLRLRNWAALPVPPSAIDAVILSHAHLDHSGYLPRLVAQGFHGEIYATGGTVELCKILLPDSAHLQEEDAKFANQRGFSKHRPALPLYTLSDVQDCLKRFRGVNFGAVMEPVPGFQVSFSSASHLLGAASVLIEQAGLRVLFSGDLGRGNDIIMPPPEAPPRCDYLVIESTYGNRLHPEVNAEAELAAALREVLARSGVAVVPTFSVGRAQELLVYLSRLRHAGTLPDIPIYLDSPMAIEATALYARRRTDHRLSADQCEDMQRIARYVTTSQQSRELDERSGPMIILAASGMATGGRVIHHLKRFVGDARNLVLLSGFQAAGTRGASLAAGADLVRIHGQEVAVRAPIIQLQALSAHADSTQLLEWAKQCAVPPRRVYVTHGEPDASDALRLRFEHELNWPACVPAYRDCIDLPADDMPH